MNDTLFIRSIYDAQRDNRLCLFIGAGISMCSNSDSVSMPSWSDLIKELKKDLDINDDIDYLKLAELYHLQFGDYEYYRRLKELLCVDVKPSEVHKKILEMGVHNIITTNWDCLLESAALEELHLYDTIASDEGLSKSSSSKKIIKMHGDFSHHNIVFKESDYLGYDRNYPLISNYIKGILSTNTVMFLGYSYSDVNLKMIVSWIQSHSKSRQPMYLISFEQNQTQIEYLKSHGIKSIVLDKSNLPYDKRLSSFLDRIKNHKKESELLIHGSEYILSKLILLNDYKYIMYDQIISCISNCGISHGDKYSLLYFYNKIMTYDFDEKKRKLTDEFLISLKNNSIIEKSRELINLIFTKAGFSGVLTNRDMTHGSYLSIGSEGSNNIDKHILNTILFNRESRLKNQDLIEPSINEIECDLKYFKRFTEMKLNGAIKDRSYNDILIQAYNLDFLKFIEKFNIKINDDCTDTSFESENNKEKENFKDANKYYESFPSIEKEKYKYLIATLSNDYLYKRHFNVFNRLSECNSSIETLLNGGISSTNNDVYNENKNEHINLIRYFAGNGIVSNQNSPYKKLNQLYFETSMSLKKLDELRGGIFKIELSIYEIYSLICHYRKDELSKILTKYIRDENNKFKNILSISDKEEHIDYIGTLLDNITQYTYQNSYIQNAITVFSYTKLPDIIINKIISTFVKLISTNTILFDLYRTMDQFFALQVNIHNFEFDKDKVSWVISSFINKIISGEFNYHDRRAINIGEIRNIFRVATNVNLELDVENNIKILMIKCEDWSLKAISEYIVYFLMDIWGISNEDTKKIIENEFIKFSSTDDEQCNSSEYLSAVLTLIANDHIKNTDRIENLCEKYIIEKTKSAQYLMLNPVLTNVIRFLANEKKFESYQKLLLLINGNNASTTEIQEITKIPKK